MALYEFKCLACETVFEQFFKQMVKQKQQKCPACGERADKIISIPSVIIR